MAPYLLIITNRLYENESFMYQFYRFTLFQMIPFFLDYSVCHFEMVELLKLLLVKMAFFHILVVK